MSQTLVCPSVSQAKHCVAKEHNRRSQKINTTSEPFADLPPICVRLLEAKSKKGKEIYRLITAALVLMPTLCTPQG